MQCQVCKQDEATVHLTQIVDDDVRSLDLCEGCAKQKGVSDPLGFSFADVFKEVASGDVADEAEEGTKPAKAPRSEVRCARCGLSHADFKKTGRLGCSDCYQAFGDVLDSMLKGMHKGIRHTGKTPALAKAPHEEASAPTARPAGKEPVAAPSTMADVEDLSALLSAAVEREDFEAAAKIRDRIRAAKAATATQDPRP